MYSIYDMIIFMGIYCKRLPITGRRQEALDWLKSCLQTMKKEREQKQRKQQKQKDESAALDG